MFFEVHTFGGGEYLVDIFNGVAALCQGANYTQMLVITGMLGLTWILFEVSFTQQFKRGTHWFVAILVIYNVMFVPKVSVYINDHVNPHLQNRLIKNVPFALGMFAGLSSQIGASLTELSETAFSLPNDFKYHKNGMLFGSKLVDMANRTQIVDTNFSASINDFMKQCVFYDILLKRYSLDDLKRSSDIWNFLTVQNTPSVARSFSYYNPHKTAGCSSSNPFSSVCKQSSRHGQIVTCKAGADLLANEWNAQITKTTNVFFNNNRAKNADKALKDTMLTSLPLAYSTFLGISAESSHIIKQNMLIHALRSASEDFAGNGPHGAGSYAAVRADIQANEAYTATKRQAEKWLPILKVLLEAIYYGSFPFVFLLMLLPVGTQVAKGYFVTFMWLQSWGPLFAILNRVMSGMAASDGFAATALGNAHGLALVNHNSISMVNNDIAVLAGYMSMFIPFIAAGLTKGAMNFANMAGSMLAIPQSAATQAAQEVATGNISIGNTSLENQNYNNTSANHMNNSATIDSGRLQVTNSMGGTSSQGIDGSHVFNQSRAISHLPNLKLRLSENYSSQLLEGANAAQTAGEQASTQAGLSRMSAYDTATQHIMSQNIGSNSSNSWIKDLKTDEQQTFNAYKQRVEDFAHQNNISNDVAVKMVAGASANLGFASLGASGSIANASQDTYSAALKLADSEEVRNALSLIEQRGSSKSLHINDSKGNSLDDKVYASLSDASRYEQQSRTSFERAQSLREEASYVTTHASGIDRDLTQQFINWGAAQRDLQGREIGHDRLVRMLHSHDSTEQANSERLVSQFMQDYSPKSHYDHDKSSITATDLNSIYKDHSDRLTDGTTEQYNARMNQVNSQFHDRETISVDNSGLVSEVDSQVHQTQSKISGSLSDFDQDRESINSKINDNYLERGHKKIKSLVE